MDINGISNAGVAVSSDQQILPLTSSETNRSAVSQHATEKDQQLQDKERMKMMVESIQSNLSDLDVSLTFSTYGKNNNQISIAVVEKATGTIIREIPSKELQALYAKMQEVVGMIFDKEA